MKVNTDRFLDPPPVPKAAEASAILAGARKARLPLAAFPGDIPNTRAAAYRVQDSQIILNSQPLVGWKVAVTWPAFREAFGADRLVGPIFADRVIDARPIGEREILFTQILGGLCAVEAEFIAVLDQDIGPGDRPVSAEEASDLVRSLHIGVEIAGSPVKGINDLGSFATTSDCGCNDGVIIGPDIKGWRDLPLESLRARTSMNAREVGYGTAATVPDGPMAAVAFLINCLSERKMRLKAGDLVSTGATTGVHVIQPGHTARIDFGKHGLFNLKAAGFS